MRHLSRAISIDFLNIVKLTEKDSLKVGPCLEFPDMRNKKLLKELNKQELQFIKLFEKNLVFEKEIVAQERIINSIKEYKKILEYELNIRKEKTKISLNYHLFANSNLFLTSLYLYGALMDKKNEDYIRDLVDNVEGGKKLSQMLLKGLESATNLEKMNVELFTPYKKIIDRSFELNKGMMPTYHNNKGIAGYRADLKRTLFSSSARIKFKEEKTLNLIAELVADDNHLGLLERIAPARYKILSQFPESKIELELSGSKKSLDCLIITNESVDRRRLVHDIYYSDQQERFEREQFDDVNYEEFNYDD